MVSGRRVSVPLRMQEGKHPCFVEANFTIEMRMLQPLSMDDVAVSISM